MWPKHTNASDVNCISTTVKHGGREVSWCGEPFQLLVLVSCFTHCEKSINALEYRRILQKSLLPTIEKLFSEVMLFFNKTMLLPTLQRPPKGPSGSCFGPVRVQI